MRPTVRSRRLGSRLGHHRRQRGLSGTELATRLGIHQATWSKIEAGKTKLSPTMLVRATEVLDIPTEAAAQLNTLCHNHAERLITAASPHIRVADMDRYLELRMRRQKRLADGLLGDTA